MPFSILMVVVLPAPFGPSKPKNSPSLTVNDMPSTAVSSPNRFTRPSTSMELSVIESPSVPTAYGAHMLS
jgi:hypothetical protein